MLNIHKLLCYMGFHSENTGVFYDSLDSYPNGRWWKCKHCGKERKLEFHHVIMPTNNLASLLNCSQEQNSCRSLLNESTKNNFHYFGELRQGIIKASPPLPGGGE